MRPLQTRRWAGASLLLGASLVVAGACSDLERTRSRPSVVTDTGGVGAGELGGAEPVGGAAGSLNLGGTATGGGTGATGGTGTGATGGCSCAAGGPQGGAGVGGEGGGAAGPVADFHLIDVNTTSPRFDELVSPRDYVQQVSAWYFAGAT